MTLRVAILCQDLTELEPWMLRLMEGICVAPEIELCGIIVTRATERETSNPVLKTWWKLEARIAAKAQLAQCPEFDIVRKQIPITETGEPASFAQMSPDVIVDLTDGRSSDDVADHSRLGVWFLDFLHQPTGAAALRAIVGPSPVTRMSLLRFTGAAQAPEVIATAALNTKFIASRNHLFMCEKSVALILRELRRASLGQLKTETGAAAIELDATPSGIDLARYVAKLIGNIISRTLEKLAAKLRLRPGMFYLASGEGDFRTVNPAALRPQPTPANQYYADPFLWEHGDELYCFFEVYDYATQHGHISAGRMQDGALRDVVPVLKLPYHLSFPFLFERNGELIMMPETCGANRIETWKCVTFPDKWERDATILDDVVAADSSLAQIKGEWWLFTNISNDPFGEMNSELHLYKIDGPELKSVVPHPLNPVVFDARTARGGGRIVEHDGSFYRMSQDNSHGRYGYGLNVMKIEHISMHDYRETLVRKIEPDFRRGVIGCHHMDTRDGKIEIDIRKQVGGAARSAKKATGGGRHDKN